MALGESNGVPALREFCCGCEADDAAADDEGIEFRHVDVQWAV
jgi:hypothetical protein